MSLNFIDRLPPEILAEIFRRCDREKSTFDLSATIWTLGRVCRTWREVSIGEPHIWTYIWINLDDLANREEEGSMEILHTVLDRSRNAGLGLHIHIIFPQYLSPQGFYQKIIDAVREESRRWVSFTYISWEVDFAGAIFSENNFPSVDGTPVFPALREVEISIKFSFEESDHRLFRAIGTSPLLEKLTLFDMNYDINIIQILKGSIPWGQLKHLGILAGNSFLPVDIFILRGILQKCSTLEHLVVDQSPWDVSAREQTSELEAEEQYPTLSTLRSLEIRRNGRWDLDRPHLSMWSIGKFPALEHFALSNFDLCQDIAQLNMAFAASCLELSSLTLRDIALSDFTVERFLREHGGHVRVLTLQGQIFDHLFDCIASSEGKGTTFLPNLEKLVVKMDERTVTSPSLVAIMNVIRARASSEPRPDGTSRVTAVEVEMYAEDEEVEPVAELEAMNSSELRIQVRRIKVAYHDGTEVNEITRFGKFLNSALYRQSWDDIPSSHLHENMPILDNIFTRFENCSSRVYEDRSYVHQLSVLRHVLEKFVKGVDALPEDYNFAKRAERLLDDQFGWNPNGRKRRH